MCACVCGFAFWQFWQFHFVHCWQQLSGTVAVVVVVIAAAQLHNWNGFAVQRGKLLPPEPYAFRVYGQNVPISVHFAFASVHCTDCVICSYLYLHNCYVAVQMRLCVCVSVHLLCNYLHTRKTICKLIKRKCSTQTHCHVNKLTHIQIYRTHIHAHLHAVYPK